eukprot:2578809-Pleurochrysis_carterae.AAC.4
MHAAVRGACRPARSARSDSTSSRRRRSCCATRSVYICKHVYADGHKRIRHEYMCAMLVLCYLHDSCLTFTLSSMRTNRVGVKLHVQEYPLYVLGVPAVCARTLDGRQTLHGLL